MDHHGQDIFPDSASQNNKVDIQLQLQEFKKVLKERDTLLQEVDELKKHVAELNGNIESLKEEHAEELAVLSSSFSQHFESKDDNNNEEIIKDYEREIQKLKNSIEDKNYHINQLQRKLMKTQVEMEKDLENHEAELENLRSQLEKLENSDTESLIELRMNELKEVYEKEIKELKAKLETEENSQKLQTKDEQLNNTMKEVDELKSKLKTLEDTMDERLQEEEMKFRREVMSVKDKLIHQHQIEIDELLTQLERSNAEVEKLRRLSKQSDQEDLQGLHISNGEIASVRTEGLNRLEDENDESCRFELVPIQIESTDSLKRQELETIHEHYQHQFEFMKKRMKEQYQQDLDESVQKVEEDNESQLDKQRSDYEDKIVGIQRQLRGQFQTDLERVTNDMEEQIQALKDGHSEEIADLMQRVRGLSDERRRSYIEQDNTQQHVIVIKEEFKSKVEHLELELRTEKEKVVEYESKLQSVDSQIQAFKAEKEQEVKYIEEELKKQCKALVEKKTKEMKERYQSELNEKVNKVEKTLRQQYDEESVRTRSELEESNRTLKEKYDNELTEIMTQMEQVQQRNQEVFEAQQKEQFEKQLSIVKEELEPFKDKCQSLENENKALLDKYNRDLSELKLKMDEVEKRYSNNEKIEEESMRTLEDELNLYKTKVKELEEGNQMLVLNYGAQLENIKKKYEENEEGEIRTLQDEVTIYTKKVEKLQAENTMLTENHDQEIMRLNEQINELTRHLDGSVSDTDKIRNENDALVKTIKDLSKQLDLSKEKCTELEKSKSTLDNRHSEEIEKFKIEIETLRNELEVYSNRCRELEDVQKILKANHREEQENMFNKVKSLTSELNEVRESFASLQQEKAALHQSSSKEIEELRKKLKDFSREGNVYNENDADTTQQGKTLTDKISELQNTVDQLRNNYTELEVVKEQLVSKHSEEKEELVFKLENQRILIEDHEHNLLTVNKEKVKLEEDLKNVSNELVNSSQIFEHFKTEKDAVIEEKNNVINELSGKIIMLQEQGDGEKVRTKKIRDENDSLKNESKRLKMFLDSLRAENNQLLDEMQSATSKQKQQLNDANEELTTLRAGNGKLSKELDRVKERYELLIVDLKDEIDNQKKALKELEMSNDQYAQEIASLVQEMGRKQSKAVSMDKDVDNSNSSEDNSLNQSDEKSDSNKDDPTQKLYEEIAELKAQNEQFKALVNELEEEGDNKFGVLLSQHEKELEILKEELEEQIARKREQLAQEAAAKRQKLKEEYESKLRVIYDELVSERSRSKEQLQQINQLGQKVTLLEGIGSKQKKDIEKMKQMEEKIKELQRQVKKKEEDTERDEDVKINIKILEDKLLELNNQVIQAENALKEKDEELHKALDKIKSLGEQSKVSGDCKSKETTIDNLDVVVRESAAEELLSAESGVLDGVSEESAKLRQKIEKLETDRKELEKQCKEATLRNEKLQKDLQNMDKAKQVVIQMYDEKMEALAIELDNSSERCDVLRKQLEMTKKLLNHKEKESEEKLSRFVEIEAELKNEKVTTLSLREKMNDLEEQLVNEKEKSNTDGNEEDKNIEVLRLKLKSVEIDLKAEKEQNTSLTHKIEEQTNEITNRESKLVEISGIINTKDTIIAEQEGKISDVEKELCLEKKKSKELESELAVFKDTDGTTLQRIEQVRTDLNDIHEKNNLLLKQNYESILSRQAEEHRIRTDEFEAEIVTLKGMVDNLEQLAQLKDEDRDILLKECEEKHSAALRECQDAFSKEQQELNEKLVLITSENDSHKVTAEELSLQLRTLSEELGIQKRKYENEIKNLTKQVDFENSFQVELQEGFQTELQEAMEKQEQDHKKKLEKVNAELQQNIKDLEESRSQYKATFKELDSTRQDLENRLLEIKSLEETVLLSKAKHEEEIIELTKNMQISSSGEEMEGTTRDSVILSLGNDKKVLEDEVQRLKSIIEEKDSLQREDIELVTSELEKRFQEKQNEMTKLHAEELDNLMMRLETLVHQESDSKALMKSHMDELNSVRSEMLQTVTGLNKEKEQEIEAFRSRLEDHYNGRLNDLQEKINAQCKENTDLQNSLRSMTARNDQLQSTLDELYQLRRENTELYRKLREMSPGGTLEKLDILKIENQKLKAEIENYKRIIQRSSTGKSSPESSGESNRLLQLMRVMEQLMAERNDLEMKLREEIIDLKTRFSPSGDGNNSSNISNISSFSEKVSRESLLSMLQDLRSNKNQQEEDIQVHIREIEKMIEDIKQKIKSTECADAKIQEMLAKQLQHLEEQRRLLVRRLWDLREKHDSVEQKLTRQIATLSSSPGDEMKSKLYQNLLEENLRKEKEQLHSKQQQVNDLRRRLSHEKALMDRRVAERQRLQKQLNEKDRQENELSTERYELERKWRDRLRAKEIELKQERFNIQQRNAMEYRDSVAARISGLISRSSDDMSRTTNGYDYSRSRTEASAQPLLNRHYLQREARTSTNRSDAASSLTEYTHFRPYDAVPVIDSHRNHSRQRDLGFKMLPNEIPSSVYLKNGLEHSTDDDLDSSVVLSNQNDDAVSIEMDERFDSDIDSYTPPSGNRLAGMEKEWERNLEDELNQISAGTLSVLPSGNVISQNDLIDTKSRIRRAQSDVSSREYLPRYGQSPLDISSPGSLRKSYGSHEYPRSSTAIPGDDHDWLDRNGSLNLSQIPTILPTLLKDIAKERDSKRLPVSTPLNDIRTQESQRLGTSASKHSSPIDQKQNISNSPNSPKSEPMLRTDRGNRYSTDRTQSNAQADHSNVYLLNMDDYIDRHRVLSSDVVASLRDLSPSERYSYC